jgi:hypothetical protein
MQNPIILKLYIKIETTPLNKTRQVLYHIRIDKIHFNNQQEIYQQKIIIVLLIKQL